MSRQVFVIPIIVESEPVDDCFFYDPPDQYEYLVAAPQASSSHELSDKVFLGIPGTTWTPITLSSDSTYWQIVLSNRDKIVLACGAKKVGSSYNQMRDIAISQNGGRDGSWTRLAQDGDATIDPSDRIVIGYVLDHGGFALLTQNKGIVVIPNTYDRVNVFYPGNEAIGAAFAWPSFAAINSRGNGKLTAFATPNSTGGDAGFFSITRSTDWGVSWLDWEIKGEPLDHPLFRNRRLFPKALHCFGNRQILIGSHSIISDDDFQTWQLPFPANSSVDFSHQGDDYSDADQNDFGSPIDWTNASSYWSQPNYILLNRLAVKVAADLLLVQAENKAMQLLSDTRWDVIGSINTLPPSSAPPTQIVYSRQHGLVASTHERYAISSADGGHWFRWMPEDVSHGLRYVALFAVCGTDDIGFYQTLVSYKGAPSS